MKVPALTILALLVALLAVERAADACCLGCACTKYKRRDVNVEQVVLGYTRGASGAIPKFSEARIAKFLAGVVWQPVVQKDKVPSPNKAVKVGSPIYHYIPAPRIRFATADKAATLNVAAGERIVLLRRIEKNGAAILVEVDDRTWRLSPCAGKRGYACLVPTELTLAPVPPVGDGSGGAFAQPPPAAP